FSTTSWTARDIGKTFQYRVRIRFLNPIFGAAPTQVDPKHPEEAWIVELPGAWSEPSEPIAIEPVVRFFFVGAGFGDRANFKLYRWIYGKWYRIRSAAFEVGDAIATERLLAIEVPGPKGRDAISIPGRKKVSFNTGATVVDVFEAATRHLGVTRTTQKLLYQEYRSRRLSSRLAVNDRLGADRFWSEAKKGDRERPVSRRPRPERWPEREPERRPDRRPRPDELEPMVR
ncbi:unnamed protein product, partial [marine sediment metagenome]